MKIVYTSESQMRTPVHLFLSMLRDFEGFEGTCLEIFYRDFLSRYRKSVLGIVWAFLPRSRPESCLLSFKRRAWSISGRQMSLIQYTSLSEPPCGSFSRKA